MKKYILVTHTDLDGIGNEILFKAVMNSIGINNYLVLNCDYNNVNEKVKELISKESMDSLIYMTDISVNEEVAELLNKRGGVRLFDHHKTATWLADRYEWATVNLEKCGTMLFWDYLMMIGFGWVVEEYEKFVIHVDDYDRWIHKHPDSKRLNQLFWIVGTDDFVERFSMSSIVSFSREEQLLLKIDDSKKKSYLEKCKYKTKIGEIDGLKTGYLVAEQYTSELGHYLLDELGLDIVAIVNLLDRKVSLRSQVGVDASNVAVRLSGGGHPQACGFEINDESYDFIIKSPVFKGQLN